MHIYTRKQRWKVILVGAAVIIGAATAWYTNDLVKKLAEEEKRKMEVWAQAMQKIANPNEQSDIDIEFYLGIIQKNETIPIIIVDADGKPIQARHLRLFDEENLQIDGARLSSLSQKSRKYLEQQMAIMQDQHDPIQIDLGDEKQYIYYKDSLVLSRLQLFPFFQLAIIFLFLLAAYFAFSSSRRAEQNQVWVGMSKETAHQLGTPISSLMAWLEIMKMKENDQSLLNEIGKDVDRLETIADRFSKIGSAPVLVSENILMVLDHAVAYLKNRSSDKVEFILDYGEIDELFLPLNISLFEWVIENLCRNAIDAMDGVGRINISVRDQNQVVYIDISDTGKGIPKSGYKVIFQPGYTTKPRGWGLGLSLVKRIVENYHNGKIFVRNSEISKGSTLRIVLKK